MSLFSRSFWKDLLLTYSAEIIVMACAFLCQGIVARLGGLEQLGVYLLLRRVAWCFLVPLSLGMTVALARCLPMCSGLPGVRVRWSLFGIGTASAFGALAMLAILSIRRPVAKLLLGSPELRTFILPLALMVLGNLVHALLYGHFRGMLQMRYANSLQAINFGFMPVLALLGVQRFGLAFCIDLMGLAMLGVSVIFLLPLLRTLVQTRTEAKNEKWLLRAARSLFPYGLGRVPGFLIAGLLFALGPIWLAHRASLTDVAIYALGLSFMRMLGAFFGPLGVLVLPHLAGLIARNEQDGIRKDLQLLFRSATLLGVFASLQAAVLSRTLLVIWLGTAPVSSGLFFVPLVLILPLYLAYEVLRSPIDAVSSIPYNTIALSAALAALFVGVLGSSPVWLVASQVVAFTLLGAISIVVLGRLYKLRLFELRQWFWPSLLSLVALPITWIVQRLFEKQFVTIGGYEMLLFVLFLATMKWSGNTPALGARVTEPQGYKTAA